MSNSFNPAFSGLLARSPGLAATPTPNGGCSAPSSASTASGQRPRSHCFGRGGDCVRSEDIARLTRLPGSRRRRHRRRASGGAAIQVPFPEPIALTALAYKPHEPIAPSKASTPKAHERMQSFGRSRGHRPGRGPRARVASGPSALVWGSLDGLTRAISVTPRRALGAPRECYLDRLLSRRTGRGQVPFGLYLSGMRSGLWEMLGYSRYPTPRSFGDPGLTHHLQRLDEALEEDGDRSGAPRLCYSVSRSPRQSQRNRARG